MTDETTDAQRDFITMMKNQHPKPNPAQRHKSGTGNGSSNIGATIAAYADRALRVAAGDKASASRGNNSAPRKR